MKGELWGVEGCGSTIGNLVIYLCEWNTKPTAIVVHQNVHARETRLLPKHKGDGMKGLYEQNATR
jgi:hypothetical protein